MSWSSSSQDSHNSTDKRCPHAQFHIDFNLIGCCQPLSTYLASAPECSDCDLLLRVVEEFKPGWIDEHKNGRGLIDVTHERLSGDTNVPALISLLLRPPHDGVDWPVDTELVDTELVDSFQIFRHSRGMFGYSEANVETLLIYMRELQKTQCTKNGRSRYPCCIKV